MFAYIKGKLAYSAPTDVIIEAGSIGYQVFIPAHIFSTLPPLDSPIQLHTSFIVRELSQTLYGFLLREEKELFETLIGISGVGPKVALSLIGHLPLNKMQQAISNHDIITISKVPGIGKKTAERLILEMQDKLSQFFPKASEFTLDVPASKKSSVQDAMSALINLGYTQNHAQKALRSAVAENEGSEDVSLLITEALKRL